jgi:hypothetical protein
MIDTLKKFWRAAPVATVILALSLSAAALFGARSLADWVYWNDPARHEQQIAGWMTPRFVSHSWKVPRHVIVEALDLRPESEGQGRINLNQLAEARGVPVDTIITDLETAISAHRARHQAGQRDK